MCTDAWVEAYALDNGLGIESFDFGVGVEFVEVTDAEGEVGVGEEFYGFCFFEAMNKVSISCLIAPCCNNPANV